MTHHLKAYNFIVEISGITSMAFTEVNGLSASVDVVEYREGSSPETAPVKIPGLHKVANVILKRGLIKGNNELFNWFNNSAGTADKKDIAIKLLDEDRNEVFIWLLSNAFPVRISYSNLKAMSSDTILEEMEIAFESLKVETV